MEVPMRRLAVVVAAAAFLVLSISVVRPLAYEGDYPVSVTFRDLGWCNTGGCDPVDKILSDGRGAYVDGGGKNGQLNAFIRNGTSNTDLVLGAPKGTGRTMQWFYTPATDVSQPTSNPPSGYLNAQGAMIINNIGAMPINETKLTSAQFNTDVGFFRFGPARNDPNYYGSQQIVVTRTSLTTWTASAFLTGAGDLAVLLKRVKPSGLTPVGLYHMPFGVEVTCLSSYCPPAPLNTP